MESIFDKIRRSIVNDSEIIQDIEHAKCNNPGLDINIGYYVCNWSLLMCATLYERKDLVEYLLSYPNINVKHRDCFNSTVLHYCKWDSILKLLLSLRDIDVNIQDKWEKTGLHRVCYCGISKACVKEYLLDARINILIRDNQGKTAQDIVLERGYPRIAKIINNSQYTTLLRIPNNLLLHDIVRMIIEEYICVV